MVTPERFLELALRSRVLSEGQLEPVLAELQDRSTDIAVASLSIADLSERLIDRGLMTPWQCDELAKGKESCFLFQNTYNLLERLPSGRYHHGYRAQSTVTSEKVDVILISVRHQTTVAIVRADQFIDAVVMWLDRYHEKFFSLGRYARCGDLLRGNHNSTGCQARDATTRDLVEVTFIPADESVSVYVTRPRAVIEIGIANWTPFMEGSEAWDPRQF